MVDRLATGVPATLQHGASEPYAGWVTLSVDRAYLNLINLATERWRQSWVRRRPSFERKKARGEAPDARESPDAPAEREVDAVVVLAEAGLVEALSLIHI